MFVNNPYSKQYYQRDGPYNWAKNWLCSIKSLGKYQDLKQDVLSQIKALFQGGKVSFSE